MVFLLYSRIVRDSLIFSATICGLGAVLAVVTMEGVVEDKEVLERVGGGGVEVEVVIDGGVGTVEVGGADSSNAEGTEQGCRTQYKQWSLQV